METANLSSVEYQAELIPSQETLATRFGTMIGNWYGEEVLSDEDRLYQIQGIARSDIFFSAKLGDEVVGVLGLRIHTPETQQSLFSHLKSYPSLKQIAQIEEFAAAPEVRGKGVSKGLWKKAFDTLDFDAVVTETRNPLSAAAIASALSGHGMQTYWANIQVGGPEGSNLPMLADVSNAYVETLFPDLSESYDRYNRDGIVPFTKFPQPTKDRGIHISDKMDEVLDRILERQEAIGMAAIGLLIGIKK